MKLRCMVSAAVAVALAGAASALPRQTKQPLMPNLVPWADSFRDYFISREAGKKLLRFSAGVVNTGQGPLELQGISKRAASTLPEYQVFYYASGKPTMQQVGQCVYEAQRLHWNVLAIAEYRLKDQNGNLIAGGNKASFCVADDYRTFPSLPGSPSRPRYRACPTGSKRSSIKVGLSVGWSDVYAWPREGQSIDVTDIPSGHYILEMEANPEGTVRETSRDDNTLQLPIAF